MLSYLMRNPGRSLFEEFDRLQNDLDTLFGGGARASIRGEHAGSYPAVNVGATPEEVHVYVFAPGVAPADFELNIQQNVLTIAGRRAPPADANGTGFLRERFAGSFRRVLTLPEDIDPERTEASCRDGVLHLRIGRRAASRPRQIAIN